MNHPNRTFCIKWLAFIPIMGWIACSPHTSCEIISLLNGDRDVITYHSVGDSIKTGYYSNGKVYSQTIRTNGFNGHIESEKIQYAQDGQIEKYAYFLDDSLRYYRFYNCKGETIDCGGTALVYLDDEMLYIDTLKTGNRSFQRLRILQPPHTVSRVIWGDAVDDEEARDYSTTPLTILPQKNKLSGFPLVFDYPGEFQKVIYWSVQDSATSHIQKGRVWRKFVVVN